MSIKYAVPALIIRRRRSVIVRRQRHLSNRGRLGLGEYARIVDMLAALAGPDTWILPSAGPDYGKMMDQAAVLRTRAFPTAMLLPMSFPYTDDGLADGVRRF